MMNYVIEPGNNDHVIIHLHQTGGNATSLMLVANALDEDATLIGLEGEVMEGPYRRFFKRYPDGNFDKENLEEETHHLYDSLMHIIKSNNLEDKKITLMGYSNGANILVHLFKMYETEFKSAILFHPSLGIWHEDFKPQKDLHVFLTYGENDPYLSEEDFKSLVKQIKKKVAKIKTFDDGFGHGLIHKEIEEAKEFLEKR